MTEDLRRACRKCHGNGFLSNLHEDGTRVSVCDDCQGVKFMVPAPEVVTVLGPCLHCGQEVSLVAATACPSSSNHVVAAPDFSPEVPDGRQS